MYRRITRTVKDRGKLVRSDEYLDQVTDYEIDWYISPFIYGEDALEYFEEHKGIKGYNGKVYTNWLYWDLDYKEDFSKVQHHALNLLFKLEDLGLIDGTDVFFSGNKGLHVITYVTNQLSPQEVSKICYNIAAEVGIPMRLPEKIFDTTVYNVNRIFRIENTKHQESGLYKICLDPAELQDLHEDDIRRLALEPRHAGSRLEPVDASEVVEKYGKNADSPKVVDIAEYRDDATGFNPMDCPPDKRRCMYMLENGCFGHGERENAVIRLAAYHKGQGITKEASFDIITSALEKRKKLYTNVNPYSDEDTHRNLDQVYSDNWNGGTYTCKTDDFLASKCDLGNGPCYLDKKQDYKLNVMNVKGLIDQYIKYGNEALAEYPKTGLKWLDKMVRLRPRNYSIINGANGSGKTSLAIQIIESLNKQKMYHLFFSLDMADSSLTEKLGSKYTPYEQWQIERAFNINFKKEPENVKIREQVVEALSKNLPYTLFDFTSSVDAKHMEQTVYTLKEDQGIPVQLCIVDYAGRMLGEHDNEYANATANALAANDIAKRGNVHYLYLSQVSRGEGDHTSALHSSRVAKSSGAWEENATVVINCWRPFGDGQRNIDNYFHIYVAKNRSGALGEHVYWWEGKTGTLSEISEVDFIEYERQCEMNNKPAPPKQFGDNDYADDRFMTTEEVNEERNKDEEDPRFLRNSSRSGNSGSRFSTS